MCAAPIRSGTPAIGVGTGNVPVIVDETADLDDAARENLRLEDLRQFDLVLVGKFGDHRRCGLRPGDRRARARRRLYGLGDREGEDSGARCGRTASSRRTLIARDADVLARGCGLPAAAEVEEVLHGGGNRRRPRLPVLGREAVAGADRLPRQGFRRRHRRAPTRSSRIRAAAIRSACTRKDMSRARKLAERCRRGARAGQPGAHVRAMAAASTTA